MKRKTKKDLIAENEQLRRDLMTVCVEPDSLDAITIKMRYRIMRDTEMQLFNGRSTGTYREFDGFLSKISGEKSELMFWSNGRLYNAEEYKKIQDESTNSQPANK